MSSITSYDSLYPAPEDGKKGDSGAMPVPYGEYDSATSYTCTERIAPYVMCEGNYYVMNKVGTFIGINPKTDYASNGSSATWLLMEHYKALFVEIFMANYAKLASAVFKGDFMFSQHGVDANGNASSNFSQFTDENGTSFIPNILFDFLTGSGHLAHKNFKWDTYGNIFLKASMYIDYATLTQSEDGNYYADFSTGFNININIGDGSTIYLPSASSYEGAECHLLNSILATSRSYMGCSIKVTGGGTFIYNSSGTPTTGTTISPKLCKEITLVAVKYLNQGVSAGVNWLIKNPEYCIIS